MDRDGNRSRPSAQKGVLLVFTALLLPVVFACAGLAVDSLSLDADCNAWVVKRETCRCHRGPRAWRVCKILCMYLGGLPRSVRYGN